MFSNIMTGLVALLHAYFLVLEMFFWDKPLGMKVFGHKKEEARLTKILAMNQGLYNGFLVAGLVWSLVSGNLELKIFFLSCVLVAGLFGGKTAHPKIYWVQAFPAALALALLALSTGR